MHIVESPSPEELLAGFNEGRALCSFLEIAQIPYLYNLAVDRVRFEEALSGRFAEARRQKGTLPILHLSCHGHRDGIQLTEQRLLDPRLPDGLVKWSELADLIRPIHRSVGRLGICMSCCGGAYAKDMAQVQSRKEVPFAWLVGTSQTIDLHDAALAFAVFYRFCQRGDVSRVFEAMSLVSGIDDFTAKFADAVHQEYRQSIHDFARQLNAALAQATARDPTQ